jgi:hypothetical protein
MKGLRFATALTAINLVLLLFAIAREGSTASEPVAPILRGRALEIVDDRGQVRSRLNVESSGEVVLRLLDQQGTIRVKLGAGKDGSGLLLADETTEPGVHLIARRVGTSERPNTTHITLKGAGGRQRVLRP